MAALPAFQQYQLAFTAHIRNPKVHAKPAGVANQRMAVYRHAIFNNFFNIVSACFPVCQQVLGVRAWKKLIRRYVAAHAAKTPVFREIPESFVACLASMEDVPANIKALAHYEWVELAVSHLPASSLPQSVQHDLLDEIPLLAPHQLLAYDYPVHKISRQFIPRDITPTYLLVFRDPHFAVQFIELNAVTFRLLSILSKQTLTGRQALTILAEDLGQTDAQAIIQFGTGILHDLLTQQALLGSTTSNAKAT
jgi:hypothetical protein